jgi:hypothetical protein
MGTLSGVGELEGVYCAIYSEFAIQACARIADKLAVRKQVGTVMPPGLPIPGNLPDGVEILINDRIHFGSTETGKVLWTEWLSGALEDGSMKCMPHPEVIGKGLERIQDAVDAIGKGVSGKKLVVEL